MPEYKEGQKVKYKPVGGPDSNTSESTGTIKSILTEPGEMNGQQVQASKDEPKYEIENDNTGKSMSVQDSKIMGPA